MKILRKIVGVLVVLGILLLYASPVIIGVAAGVLTYVFLTPQTFWERAVAFLISIVVFLLVFAGVAYVVLELLD